MKETVYKKSKIQDISKIDWNGAWNTEKKIASFGNRKLTVGFWNKKAEYYDDADYNEAERVEHILSTLDINKKTTLIDIGSGTGKITLPIAMKARKVTAVDKSPGMLQQLSQKAKREGLTNLTYINKPWEEIEMGKDLKKHDYVMASYSLAMQNIEEVLLKMDMAARKGVLIVWWAGNHTLGFDSIWPDMFGAPYNPPPDYIYLLNILHQHGIYPNVEVYDGMATHYYSSFDDAVKKWQRDLGILESKHVSILKKHLKKTVRGKGNRLFTEHPIKSAMIWWFKS